MPEFRSGIPGVSLQLVGPQLCIGVTKIVWDTLLWQEGDVITTPPSGDLTVPRTGTYSGVCSMNFPAGTTQPFYLEWHLNGVQILRQRHASTTATVSYAVPLLEHLVAGDVLNVWVNGRNVVGDNLGSSLCRCSLVRVGPKRWT